MDSRYSVTGAGPVNSRYSHGPVAGDALSGLSHAAATAETSERPSSNPFQSVGQPPSTRYRLPPQQHQSLPFENSYHNQVQRHLNPDLQLPQQPSHSQPIFSEPAQANYHAAPHVTQYSTPTLRDDVPTIRNYPRLSRDSPRSYPNALASASRKDSLPPQQNLSQRTDMHSSHQGLHISSRIPNFADFQTQTRSIDNLSPPQPLHLDATSTSHHNLGAIVEGNQVVFDGNLIQRIHILENQVRPSPYLSQMLAHVQDKVMAHDGAFAVKLRSIHSSARQDGYPSSDDDVEYLLEDASGLSKSTYNELKGALLARLQVVRNVATMFWTEMDALIRKQGELRPMSPAEIDYHQRRVIDSFVKARRDIISKYQSYLRNLKWLELSISRQRRGCLTTRQNNILRVWLFSHFENPYPEQTEKDQLAAQTGLTLTQINNWFINARVRVWKPTVELMTGENMRRESQTNNGSRRHESDVNDSATHHLSRSEQRSPAHSGELDVERRLSLPNLAASRNEKNSYLRNGREVLPVAHSAPGERNAVVSPNVPDPDSSSPYDKQYSVDAQKSVVGPSSLGAPFSGGSNEYPDRYNVEVGGVVTNTLPAEGRMQPPVLHSYKHDERDSLYNSRAQHKAPAVAPSHHFANYQNQQPQLQNISHTLPYVHSSTYGSLPTHPSSTNPTAAASQQQYYPMSVGGRDIPDSHGLHSQQSSPFADTSCYRNSHQHSNSFYERSPSLMREHRQPSFAAQKNSFQPPEHLRLSAPQQSSTQAEHHNSLDQSSHTNKFMQHDQDLFNRNRHVTNLSPSLKPLQNTAATVQPQTIMNGKNNAMEERSRSSKRGFDTICSDPSVSHARVQQSSQPGITSAFDARVSAEDKNIAWSTSVPHQSWPSVEFQNQDAPSN